MQVRPRRKRPTSTGPLTQRGTAAWGDPRGLFVFARRVSSAACRPFQGRFRCRAKCFGREGYGDELVSLALPSVDGHFSFMGRHYGGLFVRVEARKSALAVCPPRPSRDLVHTHLLLLGDSRGPRRSLYRWLGMLVDRPRFPITEAVVRPAAQRFPPRGAPRAPRPYRRAAYTPHHAAKDPLGAGLGQAARARAHRRLYEIFIDARAIPVNS